ncbi:electron transfer flavoprotein subunit beta/FixA family protein [Natribaculum luteum]|uniref:Electron transfer flavoprotein subunit beta/FixA family protein n=1 Tax=Natribaculum luteum TaxID=1586232 RepID=A0ABD5NZZ7_9EURY|nr:electron transfer flavoprotein subunit beta/FixA family protein [Natribaculum luteum]
MKILVTVSEVSVPVDEFSIDGLDIAEQDLQYELNEWDDYAIEAAVQISEAYDDVEVVCVTIGPERAEETIRTALAKEVDRAVRVWDDRLADEGLLDAGTKAEILAGVVERENPDLVLSGVQAGDDSLAATGVTLADEIEYEWAAVVNSLEFDREEGVASVHRELEGGIEEVAAVEIPAVLTIQTGINEPRYASLRGIRQAQKKPLDVLGLDDLGVAESALESSITVTSMYEPESESDAEILEGDPDETAENLVGLLHNKGVIEG